MGIEDVAGEETEQTKAADEELLSRAALIEALLFASGEPIKAEKLQEITVFESQEIESAIAYLKVRYCEEGSGIELLDVAGGFQLRTKVKFAPFIRELRDSQPRRLTGPALETLAIVAYRQPVVKSDIDTLRGVDTTPTLKTLLDRGLIKIVGHKSTVGQPALYGTTEEFLKVFGLASLGELPTLRDLKEIESDPGEANAGLLEAESSTSPQ